MSHETGAEQRSVASQRTQTSRHNKAVCLGNSLHTERLKDEETFEERHRRLSLPITLRQFVSFKLELHSSIVERRQASSVYNDADDGDRLDPDKEESTNDTFFENDEISTSSSFSEDSNSSERQQCPRLSLKSTKSGFTDFSCRDLSLAPYGREEIEYAKRSMHGLAALASSYNQQHPLKGARVSIVTHINAQTATMIELLVEFGASVRVAPCNVYSTHNAIVAALAVANIPVFGWNKQSEEDYWWCIDRALCTDQWSPNILFDHGGDATGLMMEKYPAKFQLLYGVIEESMSGVHRLFKMWKGGTLTRPAINLFDSLGQSLFNNFYLNRDNIVFALKQRADIFMAGSKVLIVGFGQVGRSTALGLRSAGCRVDIAEVNPVAALMATMDGFNVVRIDDVLPSVDVIITATGSSKIIQRSHCDVLKSGTVLLNIGHYSAEIDIESLKAPDLHWKRVRPTVHEIVWPQGKRILLLNEGRMLNLAAQHSSSFVASINATIRIMAMIELTQTAPNCTLACDLYRLTEAREEEVARLHLPTDVRLSDLTPEQQSLPLSRNSSASQPWAHYMRF